MTTGGPNEGSSPKPPSSEGSANTSAPPHSSPRGRGGSPFRKPTGGHTPPIMGVPGQSAFTPYTRPPPPPPPPPQPQHLLSLGSSRPSGSGFGGFAGGLGFHGAQAVPVGASGSGGMAALISGNPRVRKRVRDGPVAGEVDFNPVSCSLCGKVFMTHKALFGHMRSHPGRGWRGARPPPTFRAEEEFADLRPPDAAAAGAPAAEEGEGGAEDEEGKNYTLPDLNNSPPEDST